jgi:hypothetical protein
MARYGREFGGAGPGHGRRGGFGGGFERRPESRPYPYGPGTGDPRKYGYASTYRGPGPRFGVGYPDHEGARGIPGYGSEFPDPPGRDREPDDGDIRAAVLESLFQDTWVHPDGIDVAVEDGVVTLSGTVASHMEARYAWDDAWETDGVRGVVSELVVEEPAGGQDGAGKGRQGKGRG